MSDEKPQRPQFGLKFAKAYLAAQKVMEAVKKDKANPHFKSRYASFDAVAEAVTKPLNDNGIIWLQTPVVTATSAGVETWLVHVESGEGKWCEVMYPLAPNSTPQAFASAETYSKRRSLQTICGLPTDEDDDGNRASNRPPPPVPPPHPNAEALRGKVAAALKPKPVGEMTPLEKILAHGKEHGLSEAQTKAAVKAALGKAQVNPSELTDADVFTVAKHLQQERESASQ